MEGQRIASVHLDSGAARYEQRIRLGRHALAADEPVTAGGGDVGPAPYALVLAGLAACTSITLRMYADKKGWELGEVHVDLEIHREGEVESIDRTIRFSALMSTEQKARLGEIADKTPVTRTIKRGTTIRTTIV